MREFSPPLTQHLSLVLRVSVSYGCRGRSFFFLTRKQLLFGWFELVEIHAFVFKRGPLETLVNSCGIFIHVSISTAVEFCPSIVAHEGGETLKTEGREIYV